MAIVRADVETIIVARLGGLMAAAGLAVTIAGANTDLDTPLAWAVRMLGGTTAAIDTTTSAEIDLLAADIDHLLDLTEWRTLLNIIGHLDDVDLTTGPRAEKFSQLAEQAKERKEELLPLVEPIIAAFMGEPEMGYISLTFAEHNEESE